MSEMTSEAAADPGVEPDPREQPPEISYQQFGASWIRCVLHKERILRTVDQVLGDQIALGPIKAGPGRTFASVTFVGRYHPTRGEEIPGELLAYAIELPISVDFDLDLGGLDKVRFNADVVVPLVLEVHTEAPLALRLELLTPTAEQIALELRTQTRRGAMIRKVAGLDGEIRRFLLRVLDTELAKPYVRRATYLDMDELITNAWPAFTTQFLPTGPEDRLR